MKRSIVFAIVLGLCSRTFAQSSQPSPDVRQFEITPAALPEPALKYQFMFDNLGDGREGNAALVYHDAILLLGADTKDKTEKALDAYETHDLKTFDALADSLELPNVFQELDLAGRRRQCDWGVPYHDMGPYTLLPHLEPLAHATARLIKIRALRQIEQGKVDDAIRTLRLGYVLSNNVGREPTMISALVSNVIAMHMNDALAQLMNRPDAPNLYWALREFPSRDRMFYQCIDQWRQSWITAGPNLPGSARGENLGLRITSGQQISADQWREVLAYINVLISTDPANPAKHPHPVNDATPQAVSAAREFYSREHHVTPDQIAAADPFVVMLEYYFAQFQIHFDNMYTVRNMPYPEMIRQAAKVKELYLRAKQEQGGNPFFEADLDMSKPAWRFAAIDRQFAALTTVEAIRAYAANHDGKLPAKLEDVAEPGVPINPATAKPFEYRIESDVATLSDTQSQTALTYTIKIRR